MNIIIVRPSVELITPPAFIAMYARIIEVCTRTCYKSEERLFQNTGGFIKSVTQKRKHESVIEHCSITVRFVFDRTASHQLVRHRISAFSQESQRFCDYTNDKRFEGMRVICPPKIQSANPDVFERWKTSCERAYSDYGYLRDAGIDPEDARSVLPGASKTEVCTTFNLRMWRHVFAERALNPRAQWQIRATMQQALTELNKLCPVFFSDLYEHLEEHADEVNTKGEKLDVRELADYEVFPWEGITDSNLSDAG